MLLQIEYGLEEAMKAYDETGARELIGFLEGGIYEGNEYIYHYMRSINMDYVMLGGGKKAFRQLPGLLKKAVFLRMSIMLTKPFSKRRPKGLVAL